jgi:hypothetical protein
MKLRLLSLLALAGCTTYNDVLDPLCLWSDVGTVTRVPGAEPEPGQCLRVRAPDSARVSAEPLDACDADELGLREVTVPQGEAVYRYSHLDASPGAFRAAWVPCP